MSDDHENEHEHGPFSFFSQMIPSPEEVEQAKMNRDVNNHETRQFFNSLNEDQLQRLFNMINYVIHTDGMAGAYYQGLISMHLDTRFGLCLACGKKHDEELAKMTGTPESTKVTPPDSLPDFPAKGSDEYARLMVDYNMEQDDDGSDRVMCINCQTWYINLPDRVRRRPGRAGCEGCVRKEKWG